MSKKVNESAKLTNGVISKNIIVAIMAGMLGVMHLVLIMIAALRDEVNSVFYGVWLALGLVLIEFALAAFIKNKRFKGIIFPAVILVILNIGMLFVPACNYSKYSGCSEFMESNGVSGECLKDTQTANVYGF